MLMKLTVGSVCFISSQIRGPQAVDEGDPKLIVFTVRLLLFRGGLQLRFDYTVYNDNPPKLKTGWGFTKLLTQIRKIFPNFRP